MSTATFESHHTSKLPIGKGRPAEAMEVEAESPKTKRKRETEVKEEEKTGERSPKREKTEGDGTWVNPGQGEDTGEEKSVMVVDESDYPTPILAGHDLYFRNIDPDNVDLAFMGKHMWIKNRDTGKALTVLHPGAYLQFSRFHEYGNLTSAHPPETKFTADTLKTARFSTKLTSTRAHPKAPTNDQGQDIEFMDFCEWCKKIHMRIAMQIWENKDIGESVKQFCMAQVSKVVGMMGGEAPSKEAIERAALKFWIESHFTPIIKLSKDKDTKKPIPHTESLSVCHRVLSKVLDGQEFTPSGYADKLSEVALAESEGEYMYTFPTLVRTVGREHVAYSPTEAKAHFTDGAFAAFVIKPKLYIMKEISGDTKSGITPWIVTGMLLSEPVPDPRPRKQTPSEVADSLPCLAVGGSSA